MRRLNPFFSLYFGLVYAVLCGSVFCLNLPVFSRFPKLASVHFRLWLFYTFAYSASRHARTLESLGLDDEELVSLQTPYRTLEVALEYIGIKKTDVFYDLGSGFGNLVFYTNQKYGIRGVGLDIVPIYAQIATGIATKMGIDTVSFETCDFVNAALSEGTVFFVAGTCLKPHTKVRLVSALSQIQNHSWVISTSYPIQHHEFVLHKKMTRLFSWGRGTLYLQRKEA